MATTFDTRRKQLRKGGIVLKGITKVLNKVFYPKYSYETATEGPSQIVPDPSAQSIVPHHTRRGRARKFASKAGLALGRKIDREITLTVNWFRQHSLPAAFFIDKKFRTRYVGATQEIRLACNRLAFHTRQFWCLAVKLNFTPVRTQVPVGNTSLGLGTCVDVLALDSSGKTLILEIKHGFSSYLWRSTRHRMNAPFNLQTDCCANQFQLQLLLTTLLYKNEFPAVSVAGSWVIRCHSEGCDVYHLRPWACQNAAAMLETLKSR